MLDRLPVMLARQTRSGTYGSWYNYYLCDFDGSDHPARPGARTCNALVTPIQAKLKNLAVLQHGQEV